MKRLSIVYHLCSLIFVFVLFFFFLPQATFAATVSFDSAGTVTTKSGNVGDTGTTVYVRGAGALQTWTIYWASTATGTTVNLGTCSTGLGSTCNRAISAIPISSKGGWLIHGNRSSENTAAITFNVEPKITVTTPTSGVFGTSVTVSGTGFAAEPVQAKLGASNLGATMTPTSGTGTSGTFGNFSRTATAGDMPAGANAVSATGTLSGNVTSAFNFTMSPTISLSSSSGFPGQSTNVSGHGFAASSTVTVRQNGSNSPYSSTSGSNGIMNATTFYPTGASGAQNISAIDGSANASPNVTYTLSAGTLSLSAPSSGSLSSVNLIAGAMTGTGSLGTVQVTDRRGTLVGWNATATCSNFIRVNAAVRTSGSNNTVTSGGTYNNATGGTYTITITTGGTLANARYSVSGLESATNQVPGTNVAIGTRGVTATFTAATYVVGNSWTIRVDTIPVTNLTVNPGSVTLVEGPTNDAVAGSVDTFTGTSDPIVLMSAPATDGSGIFSVTPALSLNIPIGSYANTYTATVTETVL